MEQPATSNSEARCFRFDLEVETTHEVVLGQTPWRILTLIELPEHLPAPAER
ncbi:MAG: hypothetical protein ABI520_10625 [Caldimonas sp.]